MSKLPEEFQHYMQQKLGGDFSEFMASLNAPVPTSIRINPRKNPLLNFDKKVLWSKYGRYLTERPAFTLDPLFHAGTYYVQEASSMFLEQAIKQTVDLDQSLHVLDLSAAPGGKSTHLLSLINDQSLLVSNEVIRSRATILEENILKWGHSNVIVTSSDPKNFESLTGFFDVIVVDAPCSGEGLFRKDPQAAQEWSQQNVSLCAARQKRILNDVWPALKENGILIYCTCTYNELENEDNLKWLLTTHELEFLTLKIESEWGVEEVKEGNISGYRFFPHRVNGEGFFLSVMRKTETTKTPRHKTKNGLPGASKRVIENLRPWLTEPDTYKFFQRSDDIYVLPETIVTSIEVLRSHLNIVSAGTTLATQKHEKSIPHHAAALSVNIDQNRFNRIPLSLEDAIKYLRKDQLTPGEFKRGYSLVTYQNVPLGWVNVLETRINNLYPSEWRIRMSPNRAS